MPLARNKQCPCGSRHKYKHCCEQKLEVGVVVKVMGLVGKTSNLFNGKDGELLRFEEDKGWWAVRPRPTTFRSVKKHHR